jgi:hypothetical protein
MEERMIKRTSYVAILVVVAMSALPVYAGHVPSSVASRGKNILQRCGTATNIVFTNLTGPLHHKYNNTVGYFVDGSNFFNQVLAQGFTGNGGVFGDVIMPMGVYTNSGGENNPGILNVYLESDNGGVPGSLIEGPLTRCQGVSNFNDGLGGNFVEFDCTSCSTVLTSGTAYWIVAQEAQSDVQTTWDEVRGVTDSSSPFAFNQTGNAFGDWIIVGTGSPRSAYEVDSF